MRMVTNWGDSSTMEDMVTSRLMRISTEERCNWVQVGNLENRIAQGRVFYSRGLRLGGLNYYLNFNGCVTSRQAAVDPQYELSRDGV